MANEMRAAFCVDGSRFEVRSVPMPEPGPGEVLVRVRNCGICGSDLHFFKGHFPQPPTVCPGHEIAGVVEGAGAGVDAALVGAAVAVEPLIVCGTCVQCASGAYQRCEGGALILGLMAPGGYADYVKVHARHVYRLPAGVDFATAAITEPLAVSVHGVRMADVRMGERVAVLGSGTIGLMATLAAKEAGAASVIATARYPHQAEAARSVGADEVLAADGDATQRLMEGPPIDVVIETVGAEADTFMQAVTIVRRGGRICVLGAFTAEKPFNPTMIMIKEATVVGALTYGRPNPLADFDIAVGIVGRHRQSLSKLVTHQFPLDSIQEAFETAADKSRKSIKVSMVASKG